LLEANLIQGMVQPDPNSVYGRHVFYPTLTWSGHEFLDNVRDDVVWKKTKEHASALKNWGFGFMGEIAKAIIKDEAKNRFGFELGS